MKFKQILHNYLILTSDSRLINDLPILSKIIDKITFSINMINRCPNCYICYKGCELPSRKSNDHDPENNKSTTIVKKDWCNQHRLCLVNTHRNDVQKAVKEMNPNNSEEVYGRHNWPAMILRIVQNGPFDTKFNQPDPKFVEVNYFHDKFNYRPEIVPFSSIRLVDNKNWKSIKADIKKSQKTKNHNPRNSTLYNASCRNFREFYEKEIKLDKFEMNIRFGESELIREIGNGMERSHGENSGLLLSPLRAESVAPSMGDTLRWVLNKTCPIPIQIRYPAEIFKKNLCPHAQNSAPTPKTQPHQTATTSTTKN